MCTCERSALVLCCARGYAPLELIRPGWTLDFDSEWSDKPTAWHYAIWHCVRCKVDVPQSQCWCPTAVVLTGVGNEVLVAVLTLSLVLYNVFVDCSWKFAQGTLM